MSDDYGWGSSERVALVVFLLGLLLLVAFSILKVAELSGMPETEINKLAGLMTVLSWIPVFLLCSIVASEAAYWSEQLGVRADILVFAIYTLAAGGLALSEISNGSVKPLPESTKMVAAILLVFVLKGSIPLLENTLGERFDFGGESA